MEWKVNKENENGWIADNEKRIGKKIHLIIGNDKSPIRKCKYIVINPIRKRKSNLKMKIKDHLKIEQKSHKDNQYWKMVD